MSLFEKVRIETFIPDTADGASHKFLDELAEELSYAFGGCTQVSAFGKYDSLTGQIVSDRVNILFSDARLRWTQDHLALRRYIKWIKTAAERALEREEVVLIDAFPVWHGE